MADSDTTGARARSSLVDRLPSWSFLAAMFGLIVFFWLLTLISRPIFWDNFLDKYIWGPIVEDEGYNIVNTIVLMVVLGLILGWLYRLMTELGETVDLELSVAVVPYLVWGSLFRVLEDADLFGPYNEDIVRTGGMAGASCWSPAADGFLASCFGVFFITPIIYVIVTFIAVFYLWVGHRARRVGRTLGLAKGLQFYGLSLVGLLALYIALWASEPSFIRYVANPLIVLTGCVVAYWIVWRDSTKRGEINPRWVMFAFAMVWFIVGMYYVLVWMTGGTPEWRPRSEVSWWVFVALIVGATVVALSARSKGRHLSGTDPKRIAPVRQVKEANRHVALLVGLVILDGLAIFISMVGFHHIEESVDQGVLFSDPLRLLGLALMLLAGPAAFFATTLFVKRITLGAFGVHPALIFFANPINVIMIWGQASDGMMTSLGIDVFRYTEKHVLPAFLIQQVKALNLPAPFGDFSATLVMIPIKILIVLLVVWLIDSSIGENTPARHNLIGLVKLAIVMVGLSPGVRDAVRLAMAT
jgi:uncharacterized membrane protein